MPGSPVPQGPELPREVGGFRLRRELGRGGMGVVYEAEEIGSGRRLALKVLLADLVVSPEAYERFQREAKLAAAISHAQCVFVYGAHQIDGAPAIAMEIVDGETLEQKVARKETIPVEMAVRWTIDLIDGLEAAHRAGVLHRDVKPSNCFVTPEGRVKVGDFGLSRTLEQDAQLTRTGQFLGSPLYASPEQIRGRALDERSDMYSCAATLYALLAGRAPYSGSNVGEVLARILSEAPDALQEARPGVPAALEAVVLRAMARDPGDRYADLGAFREALAPFAMTTSTNASPWKRVGAWFLDSLVLTFVNWGVLLLHGALGFDFLSESNQPHSLPALAFKLVTSLVFVLYFALCEGRFGSTLCKWLFGLRVVSAANGERTLSGATLRALLLLGPNMLIQVGLFWIGTTQEQMAAITLAGTVLVPLAMFSTARRSNGWRGLHELGSGTVVRPAPAPFRRARLEVPPPETVLTPLGHAPGMVGHYAVEGVVGRTPRGEIWKARDSELERSVWIYVAPDVDTRVGTDRTSSRSTRLRWIGRVSTPSGPGVVFESPGGVGLSRLAETGTRLEWWRAEQMVATLVDELRQEPEADKLYSLEQVWIDRDWNLRLLDEPVVTGTALLESNALELVTATARALFRDERAGIVLPNDLPVHAEATVSRLMGDGPRFESLAEIGKELGKVERGPLTLPPRMRNAQLTVCALFPAAFVGFLVLVLLLVSPMLQETTRAGTLFSELVQDELARASMNPAEILTDEERDAREILISRALQNIRNRPLRVTYEEHQGKLVERILQHHPSPTDEEVEQANSRLATEPQQKSENAVLLTVGRPIAIGSTFALGTCLLWGLAALPGSFLLRGGLTLSVFGIRIRSRRGRQAGRLRCLVRCAVAWVPVCAITTVAWLLVFEDHDGAAAIVLGAGAALWLAGVAHALMNPEQSIVDRLLGTRLVPR